MVATVIPMIVYVVQTYVLYNNMYYVCYYYGWEK